MNSFIIHIKRYDPSRDADASWATYEIPNDEGSKPMTALKALHWIYRYCEPIVYDYNCRRGSCGRCAMMIDGMPRLACFYELTGEHRLEPLSGCEIIRDLVVDTSTWADCFARSSNEIKGDRMSSKPMSGEFWRDTVYPINACRECMCCYAVCSVVEAKGVQEYLGPGALQQVFLRHIDGIDNTDRLAQALENGLSECTQCGLCTLVCPSQISCAENISVLIEEARRRGHIT